MAKGKVKRMNGDAALGPYYCPLCVFSFKYSDGVEFHGKDSHGKDNMNCKVCLQHFHDFNSLNEHFSDKHLATVGNRCCDEVFDKDDMIAHFKEQHM